MELLRGVDERVGLFAAQTLVGMDPAPPDGDGEQASSLRGADVEWRVTYVDGVRRARVEPTQGLEERLRVGLVTLRVLRADDDVHRLAEDREPVEGEVDRSQPLGRDDPQRVPLVAEDREEVEHVGEPLELGMERLVVRAICVDELVDPFGIEVAHLGDEPGAADRRAHELLVRLTPKDGGRRGLPRGEDDRARVDQRPVEVEEDDGIAHTADRSRGGRYGCPARARARTAPGARTTGGPRRFGSLTALPVAWG